MKSKSLPLAPQLRYACSRAKDERLSLERAEAQTCYVKGSKVMSIPLHPREDAVKI